MVRLNNDLQIVCMTIEGPHRHVVRVGIGGTADNPEAIITVQDVQNAMDEGAFFYTVSPWTDDVAFVDKGSCAVPACPVETICSDSEAIADNTLHSLATCD